MDLTVIVDGIKEKAASVPAIGNSMKMDFGTQVVHIDGNGDSNVVTNEDKEADCTLIISPENFGKLVSGDLNPMMAVMTGKIKIKGDMGVAMKLQSLLG